jgi:tRNA A-37 threonylcarbamoyl transferase component Bud32
MTRHFIIEKVMATDDRWRRPPISPPPVSGLPTDLQLDATHRLGIAALIYALAYFLAYFGAGFSERLGRGLWRWMFLDGHSLTAWGAILLSIGVFLLARSRRIAPARMLDLGLVFEVIGAIGIAGPIFWSYLPPMLPETFVYTPLVWSTEILQRGGFVGIPWECIWIVMFPMLAPNRPWKILVASLLAASAGPATILLAHAHGAVVADAPVSHYVRYFLFSNYLCAGLAVLSSWVFQQFGRHLRRAREIGSYHLVKPLGKGGMGEVWLAEHRMLSRPAAIKLIRPEVLGYDPSVRNAVMRRFEREAQATAALRSCHTIDLYDFGFTETGSFYYVMELLDGLDLHTLVQKHGPLPPARTVHLLRGVCHSLAEAHYNNLIHRDIKPANIYLCRLGLECDFVKVLDFGIVKTHPESSAQNTQLTQEGIATGTPGYMAPEVALGKGAIDGRADIYSLGCVGYWLLTGHPVFSEESPLATVLAHVQDPPVPPSERAEIAIPARLERIIMACLEKNPERRPQGARELDALLAECETGKTWTAEMAEQWWGLHWPRVETPGPDEVA